MAGRPNTIFLGALVSCLACSSGGSNGSGVPDGGAGSGAVGGSGATAGGGAGGGTQDSGVGGTSSGGTAGSAGAAASGGLSGSGGSGGAPLPVDVKDSVACQNWCGKLDSACGSPTCAPADDCKIPPGQCAASTEAYLECQASTGQFSCGSSGHTIIHNCDYNPASCPPGTIVGASCEGNCGGKAPSGCYCDPTCKQYGDCCSDYDEKCSGSGGSGGSGGGTGPYAVPSTCAEANNGKGCCGWGSSPYDQIAYTCVNGSVVSQSCGPIGCVLDNSGYASCGTGADLPATPNCFSN